MSGTEDARSEAWTDLPSGIVLHGALSLPGRVRVLARTEPVAETTLPPAEAERLARALADAGYEVSLETRLHPRRDAARATILRLSERLAVPVDPARLEVAGDFEMAPGASLRADVTCASARLHAGCALEGDVQALHDVEVGEGARVRGRVACGRALHVQARARVERGAEARTLRLEPGALVQGRIRARDSVATPAARAPAGPLAIPDDASFEGELRLAGPIVVRASGTAPLLRREAVLRVTGDVRVEAGARVPFGIEATGDIEVMQGARLLAPAAAGRSLRVARGDAPSGEGQARKIAIGLERALDL